ncbi:radical SAM protein [bacterium]|nr:radical SAM protein [bacterium]
MRRAARPTLAAVVFEVTPRCNLACRYCYAPWQAPTPQMVAPAAPRFARAERALRRLFAVAAPRSVSFTGGEPLLAERLPELVLLCRLQGAAVNIISNGTVGTRDDYSALVELGMSIFELPLLSAECAVHDALTGKPGSWQRVLRSLDQLQALGARVVPVVVLTRDNCTGLADTLAFLANRGLRQVMINRFNPGGRGLAELPALLPTLEQLREAFATADAQAAALGLKLTSNVGVPHCLVDPHAYRHLRFTSCSADAARRPLVLDLDGNLRLCNHSPVVFGNLFAEPLAELLACDYLERWRRTIPEACVGCARWPRCFGGCRAAAEQMGGTLADCDPLLAMHGASAPGTAGPH